MKIHSLVRFAVAALFLLAPLYGSAGAQPAEATAIVLETEMGEIEITLDFDHAPVTSANFMRYVDAGLLDGATFYRTVTSDNQPDNPIKIAVIQGGMGDARQDEAFDPIRMEGTGETGIHHLDGTISMARLEADTATAEFFICIGDQPELDEGGRRNPDGFGFAAFGRVTRGMDVVRRIHIAPADGQTMTPPILILGVRRRP